MALYYISVVLHILAVTLWIGHMVFWSLFVGPVAKNLRPPESGKFIRELSARKGGLGWPCLFVLFVTGIYILYFKGFTWEHVFSGDFLQTSYGLILSAKLTFVLGMIAYQTFVGHRPAPKLIYADMLAAFSVIALSILLARSVSVKDPHWDFQYPQPYLKGVHADGGKQMKHLKRRGNVKPIVKSREFKEIVPGEARPKGDGLLNHVRANAIDKWALVPGISPVFRRFQSARKTTLYKSEGARPFVEKHLRDVCLDFRGIR